MITFPLIDAHIHIWDLQRLDYPWLAGVPAINRTYLLWGSDWPHALRASSWRRWLEAADALTASLSEAERRKIFHANTARFYRFATATEQT